MWIESLPNGKYKFVERYVDPLTGKTRRVSVTHTKKTKKVQEEMFLLLQEKIEEKSNHQLLDKNVDFATLIDDYLVHYKERVKPTTFHFFHLRAKQVKKALGDISLKKLTAVMINNYLLDLKPSIASVHKILITQALTFGYQHGYIASKSMIGDIVTLKQTRPDNSMKYLEPEEVEHVLNCLKPIEQRLFTTMLLTGARYGEVVALRISDIDFNANTLTISRTYTQNLNHFGTPKNGKTRTIHFNNEARKVLTDQVSFTKLQTLRCAIPRDNDLLFKTNEGRPYLYSKVRHSLRKIKLDSGKKVTTHIFRHTFITRMVEAGIDSKLIAEHVGHSNTVMVEEVYSHFSDRMDKKLKQAINTVDFL